MDEAKVKVKGNGRASGAPDYAKITIEISAQSVSTEDAFEEVARRSRALEDLLDELRIPEEAIRSKDVQLRDAYRQNRDDPLEVVAENELEVTVPEPDTVGRLITAAVRRTDAHVKELTWKLTPGSQLHRDALRLAAEDARAKAEAHATAMGVRLGRVIDISDWEPSHPLEYHERLGRFTADQDAGMEPAFKIFEGRIHVDASIEVTFALDDQGSR